MQVLQFADFAARRQVARQPDAATAQNGNAALVVDRWAQLHSAPITTTAEAEPEFWSDLQLRLAYPTLHIRHH